METTAQSPIRTRFAPSPTGRLHLGHALAARIAHDLARSNDGVFLLRHEDIDATRVREEYVSEIEADLQWLGFTWDEPPMRQSTRADAYAAALQTLCDGGYAYPCFCTRREILEEIARIGQAPHGPEGPTYPGTCRNMDPAERGTRLAAGQPHAWRLHAREATRSLANLTFTDIRHGTIAVDPEPLGDVILARKDIGPAYHLAVVVDDAWQGISHVTRGEDLLPSTHVHRILQTLLSLPEPIYFHHPLVCDAHGKRLAKRDDALSLATLRASGQSAEEVLASIPLSLPGLGLR